MTINKIKLFKGERFKSVEYTIGCFRADWTPEQLNYTIPARMASANIMDGDAYDKDGLPLPAVAIAEEILKQNRVAVLVGKGGSRRKEYYNNHYFFDYHPTLKDFFARHRLPIPADGKSMQDRAIEQAINTLKMANVIDPDADITNLSAFEQMNRAKAEVAKEVADNNIKPVVEEPAVQEASAPEAEDVVKRGRPKKAQKEEVQV